MGGATDRNDTYLKDMQELREKVRQLENTNHELQRAASKSALSGSSGELKLQEAMSTIEKLEKALKESNEKVDQLDNANYDLRKEKEAMAEELNKLRGTKNHDQAMLTPRVSRVKVEPTS